MHADATTARASRPGASLRPTLERAGRDALYLTIGLGTAIAALVVWVVAVSVSLSLVVFVIGLPVVLASAIAFRALADLDRRNAELVLGRPLVGRYHDHGHERFLGRLSATVRDPQSWRDLWWLMLHSVIGIAFGSAAIGSVAQVLGTALLPAWYWAIPDGVDWGIWRVDSLPEALIAAPLAIPLGVIAVVLLRLMARAEAGLAAALLGPPGDPAAAPAPRARAARRRDRGAALSLHAAIAALVGFICTLVWGLTSGGYFWPAWAWLGLVLTVAVHAFSVRALRAQGDPAAGMRVRIEVCAVIALVCVAVWALAGGGYPWPIWPILGMTAGLSVRALFVFRHRLPWVREQQLVERVDELTRTRRGALDVQAAELRRIERDLHDGAQARLVALSMQLGRAEERLSDQPELADLVRQARGEASAAIAELRDLARGIAPPILVARGLAAAVDALGRRMASAVTVDVSLEERPPPVIETAAYFVVAESLTNAAKHAGAATAHVAIARHDGMLLVEVRDDGPGGADPRGSGLTGLRHRVEALDGTLRITSPPGGGTTIRAELPCES